MKQIIYVAAASALVFSLPALAQTNNRSGMQISQEECTAIWNQANPSGAATISRSQAQPYVTDFAAANPDGDGTLDKQEFTKACNGGLVQSAASSGASTGEAGMSDNQPETLHAPTNRVGDQVPQMRSDENKPDATGSETYPSGEAQ